MPMILAGIAVAIVLAIGAGYLLNQQQEPAWQVYSTESTRVDDPGHNLVGPSWTGQATPGSAANAENS